MFYFRFHFSHSYEHFYLRSYYFSARYERMCLCMNGTCFWINWVHNWGGLFLRMSGKQERRTMKRLKIKAKMEKNVCRYWNQLYLLYISAWPFRLIFCLFKFQKENNLPYLILGTLAKKQFLMVNIRVKSKMWKKI